MPAKQMIVAALTGLFVSAGVFAGESIDPYLDVLGVDRAEFSGVTYEIEEVDGEPQVTFYSKDPLPPQKQRVLVFIGGGLGTLHNMSAHLLMIRKPPNGRLSWFVEGNLDFLTTKFGQYPDNVSGGVGVFPFKKPTVGIAMKLYNPSYSEKTGFGPELQISKFVGKNRGLRFYTRISTPIYIGEENQKGQNFSIMPDIQLGASVKLFQIRH